MILEFLRSRDGGEDDSMGERGASTKEYKLVEFQQRLGERITPDDLVDQIAYSENPKSMRQQRWREGLKEKKDYENLLKEMRENAKKS